jgi:1-acyl-sn-glycerol-3-phosphate acyltransferase
MFRVRRASYLFNRLLKYTLGLFLVLRYRIHAENREALKGLNGAFVLLPNHFTTWDPFMLGYFLPRPVYNVTTDVQFRKLVTRILLGLVGSIPKSKVIPDIETVRGILDVKKRGGIIGIYPEGQRSWDGHTTEIPMTTAKLLRLLRLPVVNVVMKGGYLSLPRWGWHRRRGRISFHFAKLFEGDDLPHLSIEAIHERMIRALEYDEFEYQRSAKIRFRSHHRAEGLERALFVCPSCERVGTLSSHREQLWCAECGYRVQLNELGFFEPISGVLRSRTIREWNVWQLDILTAWIADHRDRKDITTPLFSEPGVRVLVGYRSRTPRRYTVGSMALFTDRVEVRAEKPIAFPVGEIEGVNVQIGERLEYYHRNVLYRFECPGRSASAMKWMAAIEILKSGRTSVCVAHPSA